jgi:MFS family permease
MAAVGPVGQARTRRRFGALRHRDFAIFWLSLIVSNTGAWMQLVATGFLMYDLTGSKAMLGMIGLASAVPLLAFPLMGGVVADRVDRVRLLFCTQGAQALLALGLAVLVSSRLVQPWHLLAYSLLTATLQSFDQPARRALTPDLVPKEDLMSANSLESAQFNGAAFTGPALYGLLVPFVGVAGAFYANAISYGAVLAALAVIRVPRRPAAPGNSTMVQSLLEGLRYVRGHPVLWTVVLLTAVTSLFARSYSQLLPAFIKDVLAPDRPYETQLIFQSYLTSAAGAGTLLGAFGLAAMGGVRRKGLFLIRSMVAFAVLLAAFALCRWYLLAAALLIGIGAANLSFGATASTLLQTIAPGHLRARVLSLHMLSFRGFTPLGSALLGPLADRTGAPGAVLVGAVIVLAAALTLGAPRREIRELD